MLTIDVRVELFKKQFPKEKIKSVQEREGTGFSVIEINHTWMCKSSKTQEGVALLEREKQVLAMQQGKIDAIIPEPVHYEENFFVYKKIPGSPLIAYALFRYGNKQRSKLIFSIAQFLWQLHNNVKAEDVALLNLSKTNWPWSVEKLQAYRHYLEGKKDMLEIFDGIMKTYENDIAESYESKLIHNGLDIKNIIVDPMTGQLRGIIDFTQVAFDDPTFDLRMRRHNPVEFTKAVALVYTTIDKKPQSSQKIYGYYFAAEFSRYFEFMEKGKEEEAQKTFNDLVKTMRDFLMSDEDGKEADNLSVHNQIES